MSNDLQAQINTKSGNMICDNIRVKEDIILTGNIRGYSELTTLHIQNSTVIEQDLSIVGNLQVSGALIHNFTSIQPDAIKNVDGVMTALSPILTSASGTFLFSDVGKNITVIGADIAEGDLRTTITSFQSSTQVTLAIDASTNVSGAIYFYGTDIYNELQSAITTASITRSSVFVGPGNWYLSSRLTPYSYVKVYGDNSGSTVIYGGVSTDYVFYYSNVVTPLVNFIIENITFDNCWLKNGSILGLQNVNNCSFENICFLNCHAWHFKLGQSNADTNPNLSLNNQIINCTFDGHDGTLEMLLLFNVKNTQVIDCTFTNNVGGGPIVGLWQKCYDTYISRPYFIDNNGFGIYYSFTCDNTIIEDLYAENIRAAITGANTSDNGQFGIDYVYNLQIINPTIIGGANSTLDTAIVIGSVYNLTIINPDISTYQIGINFIARGTNLSPSQNINIINPKIKNCNQSNDFFPLHAGMNIDGRYVNYMNITGGEIYDDQASPTQKYPISVGGGTLNNTRIKNVRLSAPASLSGTSIILHDGGAIGTTTIIQDNMDYSGSNPSQKLSSNFVDLTSNQTITGIKSIAPSSNGYALNVYQNDATTQVWRVNTGNTNGDNSTAFIMVGSGGQTPVVQFGDSMKINGNFGDGQFSIFGFANKKFKFLGSTGATNASIHSDQGWLAVDKSTNNATTGLDINAGAKLIGSLTVANMSAPLQPGLTNQGTIGSTTYTYTITSVTATGETTAAPTVTTTTGNATLTSSNYNRLTWTKVNGSISYNIYRTVSGGTPSSTGLIGNFDARSSLTLSFNDTGLAGNSVSPPTINTTGYTGIGTTTPNSQLHVAGSIATAYVSKTSTYFILASDSIIDCTSGTFTATLPTAVGNVGRYYTIKNSGTGVITVGTTSSQTIDGSTTYPLSTQYKYVTVVSNNTNWIITANN